MRLKTTTALLAAAAALAAVGSGSATIKRVSTTTACATGAPPSCVVTTTLTCAFSPEHWTVVEGPFTGKTVCDENTLSGPWSFDDVWCDNGVEMGIPIYNWSLVTSVYHGNKTSGPVEIDPELGPLYHALKRHAKLLYVAFEYGDGGPVFDLAGPTGQTC